ncbi:SRPBCC domain-containing protein [Viridibacillus sp. YIM B01967]|uniref:SRPBCC domain-containing protein n=1 Tax=Viridibacillus soli TaxID=2798301 RepID=A0ABS1H3Q1_9BACL|nr:SRPBCC family protein [Viridibacillus soli]MBK3493926.1 SRPBCC domain-containing protein [Viridibacillus soli]
MNTQSNTNAVVVYNFNITSDKVFDACIDPDKVMKWMFPKGDIVRVEIDARVGGSFSFVDLREGKEIDHRGEYLVIDRPNRLVFTWGIPKESSDEARVIIDIISTRTGCELTLTHELHPDWSDFASQTEQAWRSMLEAMDTTLN